MANKIKFYHFPTRTKFLDYQDKTPISTDSVAYIDDSREIWTHDKFWGYNTGYDFQVIGKKDTTGENNYYRILDLPAGTPVTILIESVTMSSVVQCVLQICWNTSYVNAIVIGDPDKCAEKYFHALGTQDNGLYVPVSNHAQAPTTTYRIKQLFTSTFSNSCSVPATDKWVKVASVIPILGEKSESSEQSIDITASTTECVTSSGGSVNITSNNTYIDYVVNNSEDSSETMSINPDQALSAGVYRFLFNKDLSEVTIHDGSIDARYGHKIPANAILTYSTDGEGNYVFSLEGTSGDLNLKNSKGEFSLSQTTYASEANKAIGESSVVFGKNNIANNKNEFAEGTFNESYTSDETHGTTISSIGIGTSDENRKNAFEVNKEGDIFILDSDKNVIKLQDSLGGNYTAGENLEELPDGKESEGIFVNSEDKTIHAYVASEQDILNLFI